MFFSFLILTFAPANHKLRLISISNMDLKKKIKALGWTQERLAAEMTDRTGKKGITQSALTQMLNGDPSISRVQQIASILGVSLSELMSDEDIIVSHSNAITCPYCGRELKLTKAEEDESESHAESDPCEATNPSQ